MSEERDIDDQGLEGMLRRWGAEEAANRTRVGQAPREARPAPAAPVAPRTRAPSALLRWLPLAAAMVLTALTVGFFLGTQRRREQPTRAQTGSGADPAAALRRELADLTDALAASKDDLHEAQRLLAAERAAADKARQELKDALRTAAERERAAAAATRRADDLASKNKALTAALATLEKRAGDLKLAAEQAQGQIRTLRRELKDFAKAKAELARLKMVDKKLRAATSDLQGVQKLYEKALAETNRARRELAALKSRPAVAWESFRRAYLAAAAPGQTGLAALQAAVDRARLLPRCAELRKTTRTQPMAGLLDQIEVVLTRLTLLMPGDFRATNSFAAMVRNGKYVERIDEALESQEMPPAARGWMVEAKLILSGVERVG